MQRYQNLHTFQSHNDSFLFSLLFSSHLVGGEHKHFNTNTSEKLVYVCVLFSLLYFVLFNT